MGNKKSTPRNYLSENDLIFLEANTKFDRQKIIEWHGAFIVDCPTGQLDKKQFIKLYKELEPAESKVEKYAEFVFNAFDTDHSGSIEFIEFLMSFNIRSKGKLEDRLNWTFTIFDIDSNGFIDKKELKRMFEILFTMLNVNGKKDDRYNVDKRVTEVIQKFDISGDKKLSREEFVQGIRNDEPLRKLLLDHELE